MKYKNVHIPSDLHAKFKAKCAQNQTSMMAVLIALITEYLEK